MKSNYLKALLIGGLISSQSAMAFEDFSKTISADKFIFSPGVERSLELDTVNQNLKFTQKGRSFTSNFRNNWASLIDTSVNMIQADLTLTEATLSNSDTQQAFMRIGGQFYNSDSATPADNFGDVFVNINIGDRGNGPEAWYEVQQSTNSDFTAANRTASESLGAISLNTPYTASITYDGNQNFSIVFNNGAAISVDGPARVGDTIDPFRAVGSSLRYGQDNSSTDAFVDLPDGGLPVSVAGTVDNVTTDTGGLVDNFSGANIKEAVWSNDQHSNQIVDGEFVMKVTGQGTTRTQRLFLNKFPVSKFGATAKLLSSSTINNTTQIRARLAHYLSNDTFDVLNGDTANGDTGMIWTQFVIRRNGGSNSAFVYATRVQNADFTLEDQLFFIDVTPTAGINLDQDYVLLIEKTGTVVKYFLDGVEVHSFDLATDHGTILSGNDFTPVRDPAFGQASSIQARIQGDAGVVHASFDDIVTDLVAPTVTLNGEDENGTQALLPEEVIAHEDEVITLTANTTDPNASYAWTQEAGELVTPIENTSGKARIAQQQVQLSTLIGTDSTLSFTVPPGSDTQTLRFKVVVIDEFGTETEQEFEVRVDETVASTLSPTTFPAVTEESGGGGGSGAINPYTLMLAWLLMFVIRANRRFLN